MLTKQQMSASSGQSQFMQASRCLLHDKLASDEWDSTLPAAAVVKWMQQHKLSVPAHSAGIAQATALVMQEQHRFCRNSTS